VKNGVHSFCGIERLVTQLVTVEPREHQHVIDQCAHLLGSGPVATDSLSRASGPHARRAQIVERASGSEDLRTPLRSTFVREDFVLERRQGDGRWLLDLSHRNALHEELAGTVGAANRWITLHALRVLD